MRDTIEMAREAGCDEIHVAKILTGVHLNSHALERLVELVRADERMSFYGQDKPVECAEGCPPNQICDYCQVVAPVKAMILAEREACAKVCDRVVGGTDPDDIHSDSQWAAFSLAQAIRARGGTK